MTHKQDLTENAQKLLMQYHDGCTNWWRKWQANSMIKRSSAARQFIKDLEMLKTNLSADNLTSSNSSNQRIVDLWSKIENRIEQEERAAHFLGNRQLAAQTVKGTLHWWQSWLVGVPAGALAALLALVLFDQNISSGRVLASNNQTQFLTEQTARQEAIAASQPVVFLEKAGAQAEKAQVVNHLELEWLRSHGRVQMIQHDRGATPVIWVSRADAIRQWEAINRARASSPLAVRNSNGIEMIERNVSLGQVVNNDN